VRRIQMPATWALRAFAGLAVLASLPVVEGQQSWPAYVIADNAAVYKKMDLSSDVLGMLPKGASVIVYFAVQSGGGNWCKIAVSGEQQDFGFIDCSELHRGHAPSASANGASSASPQRCQELVDQLMDVSGITSAFNRDPAEFASAPQLQRLPSKQRADVIAIMGREFNGSVVKADIRHGLLNECDPVNYAASLDALRTPVAGRKIRNQVIASSPAARSENKAYIRRMQEHPPSQTRLAALERLDRAFGTSNFVIDLVMSEASSMVSGIGGRSPSQAQLDEARERMAPELRHLILLDSVAVYRSASDEDIQQYAILWENEPLREFTETLKGVVLEAAEMRASATGAELKAYIDAQRGRRMVP